VLSALGVKEIVRTNPFDPKAAEDAVLPTLDKKGIRALVFEGPCIVLGSARSAGAKPPAELPAKLPPERCVIERETCTGCKLCVTRLGCPAISLSGTTAAVDAQKRKALIDTTLCTGCGICKAVCPGGAIVDVPPAGEQEARQ
jgi:indolepyruvate ferredoxin oxidoreductase alpha subunit